MALPALLALVEPGRGNVPTTVSMEMPIPNNLGEQVGTMDQVWKGFMNMVEENKVLKGRLELLSADVTSQGGVVLNRVMFTLEAQVRLVVIAECSLGNVLYTEGKDVSPGKVLCCTQKTKRIKSTIAMS
jgi:hypothetical protein